MPKRKLPSPSSKPSHSTLATSTSSPASSKLAKLQKSFQDLVDIRVTEQEAEVERLIALAEKQATAHAAQSDLFKDKIRELELQVAKSGKLSEEVQQLKTELLAEKEETRRAHAKFAAVEQERTTLSKALESLNAAGADAVTAQHMQATLNAYKNLTGIVLVLDRIDFNSANASYFATAPSKRVAKLDLKFNTDGDVTFTPVANATLLPSSLQRPVTVQKDRVSWTSSQIIANLFS